MFCHIDGIDFSIIHLPLITAMQMLFSLPKTETRKMLGLKMTMRRSIAKWFWENMPPNALAMDVPTRPASLKVDVAAFWTAARRRITAKSGIVAPKQSAIVICCLSREDCWPECANSETLLKEITEIKQTLVQQEAEIRATEPHLRDGNMLFEELASWDYSKSSCKSYHTNRHRLANMETALFKGTRLARIDASQCANLHYLAVPEGILEPHELVDGWGLFTVNLQTETATLATAPKPHDTSDEMQVLLAQNMALAATRQVNDMLGIKINGDGTLTLVRPPSIHHKPLNH